MPVLRRLTDVCAGREEQLDGLCAAAQARGHEGGGARTLHTMLQFGVRRKVLALHDHVLVGGALEALHREDRQRRVLAEPGDLQEAHSEQAGDPVMFGCLGYRISWHSKRFWSGKPPVALLRVLLVLPRAPHQLQAGSSGHPQHSVLLSKLRKVPDFLPKSV